MKVLYQEKPNGKDVFLEICKLQADYYKEFGVYPNILQMKEIEREALYSYMLNQSNIPDDCKYDYRDDIIMGMRIKIEEE